MVGLAAYMHTNNLVSNQMWLSLIHISIDGEIHNKTVDTVAWVSWSVK